MAIIDTLTHRHVVVALLVAPCLALLTWYATGIFITNDKNKLMIAKPGDAFPLMERSGCRYPGGHCKLVNKEVVIRISSEEKGRFNFISSLPLQGLLVGLASHTDTPPIRVLSHSSDSQTWIWQPVKWPTTHDAIRLVAMANEVSYFGEASLMFLSHPPQ